MEEVQKYIFRYEGEQRELLQFLYDFLMDQPGMRCRISYKVPFFSIRQGICYLITKNGSVEIGFPLEPLHEVIQEAILLDEIPYRPPNAYKKN